MGTGRHMNKGHGFTQWKGVFKKLEFQVADESGESFGIDYKNVQAIERILQFIL